MKTKLLQFNHCFRDVLTRYLRAYLRYNVQLVIHNLPFNWLKIEDENLLHFEANFILLTTLFQFSWLHLNVTDGFFDNFYTFMI